MNLILEVVGQNAQQLATERRKVFGAAGGRIGRSPECDWVLQSPYVSRHHATVRCIDGTFYIESAGENGVAVNNAQIMLPRLERHALKSGDKLFIDEFEIDVTVSVAQAHAAGAAIAGDTLFGSPVAQAPHGDGAPGAAEPLEPDAEDLDPLLKLAVRSPASPNTGPRPEAAWNHSSSLSDHFTPPQVAPPAPVSPVLPIAEDWNQTEYGRTVHPPVTVTQPRQGQRASEPPAAASAPATSGVAAAAPGPDHALDLESLLRQAGVDPATVPPETAAMLGTITRSVVQGLIDVLRARAEFRNQFRLPMTRVRAAQNNPLKFAINAEDALGSLLGRRNPGYLPPVEAFADAFDDIRFHQLAMIAGMRAGFEAVMSRFDPRQLEEQFDRQLRGGGFLSVAAKLRYWDLYGDLFEDLTRDRDSAFQRLFGEEFAAAYEKQLEALKRNRARIHP